MTRTDQHIGRDKREPYFAGDSLLLVVTVEDEATGGTRDVSGTTVTWVLSDRRGDTPIVTKDNGANSGVTLTGATNGIFEIEIDPEDTENLKGVYYHECQIDDGTESGTVLAGDFVITEDTAP